MGKYSEARAAAKQPFSLFDALCACSCMAGRENQAYFGKPPKIPQDAKPQSDVREYFLRIITYSQAISLYKVHFSSK